MPTKEEIEKERKFKANFKIESEVNAARLRQEKQDKQQEDLEKREATKKKLAGGGGGFVEKAKGFVKERSIAIAHESRDIRPRKQNYGGSVVGGGDPFGVGGMGGPFGGRGISNPFAPPRPAPAPRRKKRKKSAPARRAPPRRQSSGGGVDMMGIPKHMRWMF